MNEPIKFPYSIIIRKNSGSDTGRQQRLNFIEGTGIELTIVEDSANGEISIQITNTGDVSNLFERSITVEDPGAAEDISIFFTNRAITITEIRAVLGGSDTPSVTWTIRHGSDRSAAGNEVVTGGTTTTSVSTGSDVTSFNDATIPADSFVWLETTAQSGTVDEINITLIGTVD